VSGPDVTVLIPTRDRPASLRTALAGVWRQRDVLLDVVVVDDGSTPGAAAEYERLRSDRLRLLRNPVAKGPAGARNAGLAAARGRWVAFLDDDDLWAPAKLRCQLDAAERADAGWAWCGAVYLSAQRRVLSIAQGPSPAQVRRQLPSGSVIPAGASNVIARRSLLERLGGFDEAIFHMPDWDLWLRLLAADRGASHPDPLVGYVQHDAMLSRRRTVVLDRDLRIIERKLEALGLRVTDGPVRRGLLEWMAQSHAAAGRWGSAARTYARSAARYRRIDDLALAVGALGGARGSRLAGRVARRLAREPAAPPAEPPRWLDDYAEPPAAGR
jgi:glycosyltransferase involved in cell wall biosynthesis